MSRTISAKVENLRLAFPGEDSLLFKGLSLSFFSGEKVLLLGPSGCGKSTLLQVLSGIIPNSVEVPMKTDSIHVPEKSAYVFQDPDMQFCMPYADEELAFVLENLAVPKERMDGEIRSLLNRVGLQDVEPHTPISVFSQGMKQRLAVASAMALEPEVLFLDEPTALLDPEGTTQVWDTIKRTAEHRTVIIVEHKIDEIIEFVDRIVLFSPHGEVIADGGPQKVFLEHREQLMQYGIWYPGVWEDYWLRRVSPQPVSGKFTQQNREESGREILELKDFSGRRGKRELIRVEHAAVNPAEWVCITGVNGAGKSSLLLSVMNLLRTEGVCLLSGMPRGKTEHAAKYAGYVFQNPELQFLTNSVEEEIAYSLEADGAERSERERKTEALLERFGLKVHRGQHPFQLSTGQKRRLSVATALVREPQLLLLDEPTFGQDAKNTFALLETLEGLRQGGTAILMITHDPEIVRRFATRVWLVQEGKLAADVTPDAYQLLLEEERRDGGAAQLPAQGNVASQGQSEH
ncbi:ABC transporter ATP-binding protein [Paenibacillus turpanensis]|uniref:ABC transporter ATP-binding protein n=1 Tax=Paenibacillus turpanensis TaxID=2689078 RepID=UPI00140CAC65|nr:ABC transporter ATP-binding protein [Paenibacillus turpanensis]